ncbi:hypothetical protein BFJ63_vAg15217 [Fusarium oxysporum f. sp. narcissi]|uniref:Uncharacterized protein n=1 Tax=Fusarium oxysporum f. sp. narcissi TaxID=451672 RepID=A0A4Q2VAM2_FUSOX|nr:hypothetical protein BFJ63_vAg15217 [Fusarium oxysporum f. sp. narcissi]
MYERGISSQRKPSQRPHRTCIQPLKTVIDDESIDFAPKSAQLEIGHSRDKDPLSAFSQGAFVKESLPAPPAFERSISTTTELQSPAKSTAASRGSPPPSP